jgi:hypothetical protein
MAAAPRWRWTLRLARSGLVPLLLSGLYLLLLALHLRGSEGGFSTLSSVAQLFGNPWLLLAGWVHYLAFDLLVGSWELREGLNRAIPQFLLAPCLLVTFMLGPIGFLLFVGIRSRYPWRGPDRPDD